MLKFRDAALVCGDQLAVVLGLNQSPEQILDIPVQLTHIGLEALALIRG
ncbi:hypothetical protein [Marinovum sp. KMM 9879]